MFKFKKQRNEEGKKKTTKFQIYFRVHYTSFSFPYLGLKLCPSLDSDRYNLLRNRRLQLLSIGTGYLNKNFFNVFFCLFLPSRMLISKKKHLKSRLSGKIVWAGFLRILKSCKHRSAAKHCVQVRHIFNILDERERKK